VSSSENSPLKAEKNGYLLRYSGLSFQYCKLPVIGKDHQFFVTINVTFYFLPKSNFQRIHLEINYFNHQIRLGIQIALLIQRFFRKCRRSHATTHGVESHEIQIL